MRKLRRRPEHNSAREAGFTLIEMVISVSVLAMMVLAVSGVLNSGLRALSAAKARARANQVASEAIEELQRFSYDNLGHCDTPTGTIPDGLTSLVPLNCPGSPAFVHPCQAPGTTGTIPRGEYKCTSNNVEYTVKRYIAYADGLQATKRLAVFVEWQDLAGRHQVSQQSSLRAPDQAGITGLAPPTFVNSPTADPSQSPLLLDDSRRLVSSSQLSLYAKTSELRLSASGSLSSPIPAHESGAHVTITVAGAASFPPYNGFPVTITGNNGQTETFTVLSGAGTSTWTVQGRGNATFSIGASISFAGDRVVAILRTIGSNGSPQTSTVFLASTDGREWRHNLTRNSHPDFAFGEGAQHVVFGISRAADGKTSGAFANTTPRFCPAVGGCSPLSQPELSVLVPPQSVALGSAGELVNDINVEVRTMKVSSVDTVTLSFLTRSGNMTVALKLKTGTTCPGPDTATPNDPCQWVATVSKAEGHRFPTGPQHLYFAAYQVVDTVNPLTIDKGSTGVAVVQNVQFG
jgi:prepilin-type N-terminal cleavage/methylation domain-containing protein